MPAEYLPAVRAAAGCEPIYLHDVTVRLDELRTVRVLMFEVPGPAGTVQLCYAWRENERIRTVLGSPDIRSAQDAVRSVREQAKGTG